MLQQCGLAAAIWSNQAHKFPLFDFEGNLIQDPLISDFIIQIFYS